MTAADLESRFAAAGGRGGDPHPRRRLLPPSRRRRLARSGGAVHPNGTFDGLSVVTGRAELLTFFSGLARGGLTAFWHHVSNLEVAVDGDTATVTSLLWQPCVVDGVPHVAAGRYADRLVRTAEGWRYTLKQVRFSYWAPLAEGWDQHRFALETTRSAALPRRG